MGCLFGCFRIKDDDRGDHFISSSIASANKVCGGFMCYFKVLLHEFVLRRVFLVILLWNRQINGEKLVSKNQLAAIFLREGNDHDRVPNLSNLV